MISQRAMVRRPRGKMSAIGHVERVGRGQRTGSSVQQTGTLVLQGSDGPAGHSHTTFVPTATLPKNAVHPAELSIQREESSSDCSSTHSGPLNILLYKSGSQSIGGASSRARGSLSSGSRNSRSGSGSLTRSGSSVSRSGSASGPAAHGAAGLRSNRLKLISTFSKLTSVPSWMWS